MQTFEIVIVDAGDGRTEIEVQDQVGWAMSIHKNSWWGRQQAADMLAKLTAMSAKLERLNEGHDLKLMIHPDTAWKRPHWKMRPSVVLVKADQLGHDDPKLECFTGSAISITNKRIVGQSLTRSLADALDRRSRREHQDRMGPGYLPSLGRGIPSSFVGL